MIRNLSTSPGNWTAPGCQNRPAGPERLQAGRGRGRRGRSPAAGARKAALIDYYTSYDIMPAIPSWLRRDNAGRVVS